MSGLPDSITLMVLFLTAVFLKQKPVIRVPRNTISEKTHPWSKHGANKVETLGLQS